MIRRHPRVCDLEVKSSDEVLNWDAIKDLEKEDISPKQELDKIPKALPANIRAKVMKKLLNTGWMAAANM